ncbi:MAG: ASKHA domain-containing protein [Anaerolineales bacterium]|nr:ASKHA domain-containing protein [Anaerolineales bacterium]
MPEVTVIYGSETKVVPAEENALIGDVVAETGLPLEQPCAGRGTCGKCKVLVEKGAAPPDDIERKNLSPGEIALNNRLACRARVQGDTRIVLSPIVVYSNKIFKGSSRYKRERDVPLGLAVDLGTTTVAAFLTMLDDGEVAAGGGGLNQQTVYGSDVISRLAAALDDPENARRMHRLALASINQAADSLNLSSRIWERIQRVTIVGNVAMHHLLAELPLENLAYIPFQPHSSRAIKDASALMEGIFPDRVEVSLPPLIGGFVGSDALACLAYFGFDDPPGPMAAIDLGTNGEVMVTDGERILTASTAAGPAFEGVNISCGSRAVDGAIVKVNLDHGEIQLKTISDADPVGLTGSGLLSAIAEFRRAEMIEESGRINPDCVPHQEKIVTPEKNQDQPSSLQGVLPEACEEYAEKISMDDRGSRRIQLTPNADLYLTQLDIRELQKAKGAIRAAVDVLMSQLDLAPEDLERVVLTGSFGGQVDIDAILEIGMIPPVRKEAVETIANGAGFGAAMFLTDEGFALGQKLADQAVQVDLDTDPSFHHFYIEGMKLAP